MHTKRITLILLAALASVAFYGSPADAHQKLDPTATARLNAVVLWNATARLNAVVLWNATARLNAVVLWNATARWNAAAGQQHHHHHPVSTPAPQRVPAPAPSPRRAPSAPSAASSRRCGGNLPSCAVMQCESGGSLTAKNPKSSASGKWQIIDGTWGGYGGYAHAKDAPESVQDARAAELYAGGRGRSNWVC